MPENTQFPSDMYMVQLGEKLSRYTERLDNFVSTQVDLNQKFGEEIAKLRGDTDELKKFQNQVVGSKKLLGVIGGAIVTGITIAVTIAKLFLGV